MCVRVRAYVRVWVAGSVGMVMRVRACICIVLLIQHATRMRHTVTSFVASGSTRVFDIIS